MTGSCYPDSDTPIEGTTSAGDGMNSLQGSQSPVSEDPVSLLVRGFLIRLVYGSLAIPILLIVRPDLFHEHRDALTFAAYAYLVVCALGGAYDAYRRRRRRFTLWGKPRTRDIILAALAILGLWLSC